MAKALNIQVKSEFKKTKLAFNKSGKPLGERNDLHILLIEARRGNNQKILDMFIEPPTLEDLLSEKTDEDIKAVTPTKPATPVEKSKQ